MSRESIFPQRNPRQSVKRSENRRKPILSVIFVESRRVHDVDCDVRAKYVTYTVCPSNYAEVSKKAILYTWKRDVKSIVHIIRHFFFFKKIKFPVCQVYLNLANYRLDTTKRSIADYSKCENDSKMWNKIRRFKASFSRKWSPNVFKNLVHAYDKFSHIFSSVREKNKASYEQISFHIFDLLSRVE